MSNTAGGGPQMFEDVRDVMRQEPSPGVDWADLLDYVDLLEDDGYRGELRLAPDVRQEDLLFELGLAAGYACGLRGWST